MIYFNPKMLIEHQSIIIYIQIHKNLCDFITSHQNGGENLEDDNHFFYDYKAMIYNVLRRVIPNDRR